MLRYRSDLDWENASNGIALGKVDGRQIPGVSEKVHVKDVIYRIQTQ